MASVADVRRLGAGVLATLVTAVLVWFGTGLHPLWPLLWFAPLPVLLFAAGASRPAAALVAAAGWLLGMLNLWHLMHDVLRVPVLLLVQFIASQALVCAVAVLLHRALLRRGAYGAAVVVFPATWVAFEYLLNLISPHGTFGSLAYSQLACLPLLQLASVTGPWGMTFVTLLLPATLATAWQLRGTRRKALRVAGVGLGAIVAVLAFGAIRLALSSQGPTVKVGLIASDPPISPAVADEGPPTSALFEAYAREASTLAQRGAQVIVLPEKLGVAVEPDTKDADARFQALADRTRAIIVVGLIHVAPPVKTNEARVYAPAEPVRPYAKHHLIPQFESRFEPGEALLLMAQPPATWGVAICKDMDFTPLSRRYGQAGVGLMLVPAWDFVVDRLLHGRMAVLRGVENGFAIARAAKQGYLTVSDSYGRILAETGSDSAPFATLLADVPTAHHVTLYGLLGDWFAWLVLAGLGVALLPLVRSRRSART